MARFFHDEDYYYDRGMRENPPAIRALYLVIIGILFAFSKVYWRWRVERAEELLPTGDTGSVIISNHTSMGEVVATVCHIVRTGRRVRPIMKSEFNKNPVVKWFFARVGGIPVDRGTSDMKALRRAQHALQRGEDVLVYPEGTRIRSDDQPVEIHGGFALIAQTRGTARRLRLSRRDTSRCAHHATGEDLDPLRRTPLAFRCTR